VTDVPVDNGSGGPVPMSEIPEGNMNEVFDAYVAAQKKGGG
jgi:hypothetical protein